MGAADYSKACWNLDLFASTVLDTLSHGMVLVCVALLGMYDATRKHMNVENTCIYRF